MLWSLIVLISCFLLQLSKGAAIDPSDQAALADFYNSLTSTGSLSWDVTKDLCLNVKLACDYSTPRRVTILYLQNLNLQGTISTQLAKLSKLTALQLWTNQLSGTIPTEFGNMTSLTNLLVNSNQLSGVIPTELANSQTIQSIDLSSNLLSGTIPIELANMTQLINLNLASNQLNGTIPTQYAASKLTGLNLASNQLTGILPVEFAASKLVTFDVSSNLLAGTIPTQFAVSKLASLGIANNAFTGTIPTEIFATNGISTLAFSGNQLSGPIPTEIGLAVSLYSLDLSHNQLNGTIPPGLGKARKTLVVNLSYNQLTGTIPTNIANMGILVTLMLNNNQLSGTIPDWLVQRSLNNLYLASNDWECPVPFYYGITGFDRPLATTQCTNSCPTNQCKNGGTCSIGGSNYDSFTCECLPGFAGTTCSGDDCLPSPCQNGGSGCNQNFGKLSCSCPIEYRGNLCQYTNPFAANSKPIAFYSFSKNKLLDETGNGHDLSSFTTEQSNYSLNYDPDNEALIFFGKDVISTSPTSSITLGDSFSISVVFSISKFYLTSTLVYLTPTDLTVHPSLTIGVYSSGSVQVNAKGLLITDNLVIELNTPYLLTVTKNADVMKIFVDGVPFATKTGVPSLGITNHKMYLGYNFLGVLDEVAIYSKPIARTEILDQVASLSLPKNSCAGCLNGGICGRIQGGKKCFCPQCFYGDTCEQKTIGCTNPCKNGGKYVNGACQCAAGYTGTNCASVQKCDPITDSTGDFAQGTAYETTTGSCSSGSGSPKRQCLYDGTWRQVNSPCV